LNNRLIFCAAFLLAFYCTQAATYAAESPNVAIPEFQNRANAIITANRWTMVEHLGKELKKSNKQAKIMSRKDMLKALKELSWNGDRLNSDQESKLAQSGIRYILYGSVVHWRLAGTTRGLERADPREVRIVYSIDVIDLKSGKRIKSITADGTATGELGNIRDEAESLDEGSLDQEIDEARRIASRKAANLIAPLLFAE
jgi:hypothetical protein